MFVAAAWQRPGSGSCGSGSCGSGCDGGLGLWLRQWRRQLGFLAAEAADTWVCCGGGGDLCIRLRWLRDLCLWLRPGSGSCGSGCGGGLGFWLRQWRRQLGFLAAAAADTWVSCGGGGGDLCIWRLLWRLVYVLAAATARLRRRLLSLTPSAAAETCVCGGFCLDFVFYNYLIDLC